MSIRGIHRNHEGRSRESNRRHRALAALTAVAAAAAIAIGGASAAAAAPAHPATSTNSATTATTGLLTHTITSTMTRTRATALVTATPDHAGNIAVRLANGKTVAIPAADKDRVMGRAAQQSVSPDGTVYGNCGSSYVTLTEKPDRYPVAMQTGFTVITPAVGYDWSASVTGPNGYSYAYASSGGLFFDNSWNGGYQSSQDQATGIYEAAVDPAGSDAVLWDGDICYSGGPLDAEYLTVPEAACLTNEPAGAVASGGGWINNTTEPVAHRNKTTTPPDGPGARPTLATACLTNPLGTGSDATGDITGWQDAQLFVATNAPGTAIARCHLIANILGGKGQILDGGQANLVPCWQVGMNTGTPSMRTYEAQVQAAVATLGTNDAVYYQVLPNYIDATSTIPWSVDMSATVEHADGTTQPMFSGITILNTQASSGLNLGN